MSVADKNCRAHSKVKNREVPSTEPKKTLASASLISKLSAVLLRIFGLALTSETASFMATFATLPITELKVKITPILTEEGFWQ